MRRIIDGEENDYFSSLMSAAVLLSCLGADMLPSTAQCSCQPGAVVGSPLLLLQSQEMLEVSCQVELSLLKFRSENPMLKYLGYKGK